MGDYPSWCTLAPWGRELLPLLPPLLPNLHTALQSTGKHYSALESIAEHWKTLQCTGKHYKALKTLHYTRKHYSEMESTTIHCRALYCNFRQCNVSALCTVVHCSAL